MDVFFNCNAVLYAFVSFCVFVTVARDRTIALFIDSIAVGMPRFILQLTIDEYFANWHHFMHAKWPKNGRRWMLGCCTLIELITEAFCIGKYHIIIVFWCISTSMQKCKQHRQFIMYVLYTQHNNKLCFCAPFNLQQRQQELTSKMQYCFITWLRDTSIKTSKNNRHGARKKRRKSNYSRESTLFEMRARADSFESRRLLVVAVAELAVYFVFSCYASSLRVSCRLCLRCGRNMCMQYKCFFLEHTCSSLAQQKIIAFTLNI